ncbi:MAG: hypothetical protein HKN98_16840 [Silicimonas sp.]|nr:hypothetical protein [Silicimonas sp.]
MIANDRFHSHSHPGLHTPLMFVQGSYPGPRLVVTGPREPLEILATRLWDLDGLGTICGVLILRPEDQPALYDRPDKVLTINDDPASAYRRTMACLRSVGMLRNRAIPHRRIA